jgi:formylmethanofuran dehydrogenase subunit C
MIRLALKGEPPFRLSLDGMTPRRLAALSAAEIERLPLYQGNRQGQLADWFAITVTASAEDRLVIAGGSQRLDDVGGGMESGEIVVEGDVGARAGLAMVGGRLAIAGSAGFGAATAMRGGELSIGGDAGDQLGGALPGEGFGMRDGIVIVAGNAGSGAGDRMQRGLVVVGGAAGPFCASRLFAGTIVVGGALGAHPGIAMRRGSLVALGRPTHPPPNFADCGIHELVFQRLLAHFLAGRGLRALADRVGPLRRWFGDPAVGGKGEILTQV